MIESSWKKYGFDVELPTYEVLLSFPKKNLSNKVKIVDGHGFTIFEVRILPDIFLYNGSSFTHECLDLNDL